MALAALAALVTLTALQRRWWRWRRGRGWHSLALLGVGLAVELGSCVWLCAAGGSVAGGGCGGKYQRW